MSTLCISDLHLGVNRQSGTTPTSAQALQSYLLKSFDTLINQHLNKDLLIAGDLFDAFTVDSVTLLRTYEILANWLQDSGLKLTLLRGNHDWRAKADAVSSFNLLGSILLQQFGSDKVQVVNNPILVAEAVYCIPHLANQDMFDTEIEKAAELKNHLIIFHANWLNHFATNSDHSLNVNEEQARALLANGNRMFFGHEHQRRTCMSGSVMLAGNQFPSSISDCLSHGAAQTDGMKFAHIIEDDRSISALQVWSAKESYAEVNWQELDNAPALAFLRVVGKATAEQAADVVDRIANFRRNSDAFVIGNAVQVEGVAGMDELAGVSFESVKSFDVLGSLLDQLDEREATVVKELMRETV